MSALLLNLDLVLEAVHLVEGDLWMVLVSFLSLELDVGDLDVVHLVEGGLNSNVVALSLSGSDL